jgi:hypothetical protein
MVRALLRGVRTLWLFTVPDDRGAERHLPYPTYRRFRRDRVPRPLALFLGVWPPGVVAVWFALVLLPLAGQLVGHRLWTRLVLRPWAESVRANPRAIAPPPSFTPLLVVQGSSIAAMAVLFMATAPACNRRVAKRYRREMLGRSRCPWCTYDLSGSPPHDGVVVCPECSAAWRERIGATG